MATRAKTSRKRTPRKPKATPGVNLVDTAEEIIKDDEPRVQPPREKNPGPKKVLDETGKAIADAGAIGLVKITKGKDNKGLLFVEAQSITAPLIRILGRRVPSWLKKFAPSVKVNPDDAADLEEIAVTLGKYALRILMVTIQEYTISKEKEVAEYQQRAAMSQSQPPQEPHATQDTDNVRVQAPVAADAFGTLGSDFGLEA